MSEWAQILWGFLNQTDVEKFSCLSYGEPRNLPRSPKPGAKWSVLWKQIKINKKILEIKTIKKYKNILL